MFYLFRNCNCQLSYIFRNDNCWLFYLLRNHHCQLFYHFRKIIVDCFFRNTTSDCFIFLEVTIANCFIHFLGKSTFISVIHFLFMYICFAAAAAGCWLLCWCHWMKMSHDGASQHDQGCGFHMGEVLLPVRWVCNLCGDMCLCDG